MRYTIEDLAGRFGLELHGDGSTVVDGICSLVPGVQGGLSFLSKSKFRALLGETAAAAVIVGPRDVPALKCPGLIANDPYLAFARVAVLFDPSRDFEPGIHPSAVIAPSARIEDGVHVGAQCVIGEDVEIGAGSFIGPASIIGRGASIGRAARFVARVHVADGVQVGQRCLVQPGAVLGSRGFGNALGPQGWEEVPQLGSLIIGDDVEVGANTCIDRGAIEDTLIGNNVRLDNLIQIAHNCHVGDHTAIAACTGIAGSTRIGKRCMIGGAVGISGHLQIVDDVVILGRAMVTHSLVQKGVYGSGMPAVPAREWRRTIGRLRRLDRLENRIRMIEGRLAIEVQDGGDDEDQL